MMVHAFEEMLCVKKPIDMVCYKVLCDVGQFYLLFNSLRLLVYMQFAVRKRLAGLIGIIALMGSVGEYRKFGGVWMVGEFLVVGLSVREIWNWENVLGCGPVGGGKGRCGKMCWGYGKCVGVWEVCGECGKVWGGVWGNVFGVWVEVWKGCWVGGKRCWIGVGVGKGGVQGSVGRNVGQSGGAGNVGRRVVS